MFSLYSWKSLSRLNRLRIKIDAINLIIFAIIIAGISPVRLPAQRYPGVVVGVDGFAEVDGVLEFLPQHLLAGVAR